MELDDEGIGIPDSAARSGLRNLQHRADGIGGTFTIGRTDCGATHLVWTAPIPLITGR